MRRLILNKALLPRSRIHKRLPSPQLSSSWHLGAHPTRSFGVLPSESPLNSEKQEGIAKIEQVSMTRGESDFADEIKLVSSSSIVTDVNDTTRTPLFLLSQWFVFNQGCAPLPQDDPFEFESIPRDNGTFIWTSTFIDPITGYRVEAGRLPETEPDEVNGRFYYNNKKYAKQAGAQEALKHFVDSNEATDYKLQMNPKSLGKLLRLELQMWYQATHNLCIEENCYEFRQEILRGEDVGGVWWTATFTCPVTGKRYEAGTLKTCFGMRQDALQVCWYKKSMDATAAVAARVIDSIRFEKTNIAEPRYCEEDPSNVLKGTALEALLTWYQGEHGEVIEKECFVTKTSEDKWDSSKDSWWTASFICPIDGDRYDAGILWDTNSDTYRCVAHGHWYSTKEGAIEAAAAHAIDSVRFKESHIIEPRYSREDPSGDGYIRNAVETVQAESDDEDYVIEHIPQRIGVNSSRTQGNTTLDVIAETLIGSAESTQGQENALSIRRCPKDEMRQLVDDTYRWINQQKKKSGKSGVTKRFGRSGRSGFSGKRVQFGGHHQSVNIRVANIMMNSLAQANQRSPFGDVPKGVEEVARALLEWMWLDGSSKPTVDSYNAYLLCLEGGKSRRIAERAQGILHAMKNRIKFQGRRLPIPNIATFNAVIQLWALVDSESATRILEEHPAPNRETFLRVLSAYSHCGFDDKKVSELINEMERLFIETGDESLRPDTQVYNAALRWSGGSLSGASRPYSRCIPWDIHDLLQFKGFRKDHDNDHRFQNALAMQSWLKNMEANESEFVKPNIETYESVIQAWIRTGTREGLNRAETLAKKVIDCSQDLRPRPQTFQPILAAWIYCGLEDSHDRIKDWIDRLAVVNNGELVDGRTYTAPILATLCYQKRHEKKLQQCRQNVLESTIKSVQCLDGLVGNMLDKGNVFVDSFAFQLIITAWHNVAVAHLDVDDEVVEASVAAILETVEKFDEFVAMVNSREEFLNEISSQQLRHLLFNSTRIYATAIFCLGELDRLKRNRSDDGSVHEEPMPYAFQHLQRLEKMVRRSVELRSIFDEQSSLAVKAKARSERTKFGALVYEDLYEYDRRQFLFSNPANTPSALVTQLLETATMEYAPLKRDGELVRLAMLTTEVLEAEKDVEKLNAHVRDAVRFLNNLSKHLSVTGELQRGLSRRLEAIKTKSRK